MPASFEPLAKEQKGVSITRQWAKLSGNGRLRLQRPPGGWLSQPIVASKPAKKRAVTASLPPPKKRKGNNDAAETTGSLPPAQKKKAAKPATATKQEESTKPKKSASAVPAENTAAEPGNPETETEPQAKPPNYSRYALPKEKCRRIGEKGTDHLC